MERVTVWEERIERSKVTCYRTPLMPEMNVSSQSIFWWLKNEAPHFLAMGWIVEIYDYMSRPIFLSANKGASMYWVQDGKIVLNW